MDKKNIRNFCILAHIDHGKSTLADRFLEITGTVEKRKMREQFLDMNPLEREKGITIKMAPVRMIYNAESPSSKNPISKRLEIEQLGDWKLSNSGYILNLIDTPGHVDFSYEVSRALAAVEGAILLVDATQGIQAQTLANLHLARQQNLTIIPVVNKIDLPSADIEKTSTELAELLDIDPSLVLKVSGKTGEGVEELLRAVTECVPPPREEFKRLNVETSSGALRALVFDSSYDQYQGVIACVRIFEGSLKKGEKLRFLEAKSAGEALEIGVFSPGRQPVVVLREGEIGYIATGIKEPNLVRAGDTVSVFQRSNTQMLVEPLPGYKEPIPMVYASIFPENQDDYEMLRDSLHKLKLNDSSLSFEPEDSSAALGRGFRTGFLGMLHMEITAERLKREYGLSLIFSNPSVAFRVIKRGGQEVDVYSAAKMPEPHFVESILEPWALVEIITPSRYLGPETSLISERGGTISETAVLAGDRLLIKCEMPLREIIIDFHDTLKNISQGFASMSYEVIGYRSGDLVRMDILVAGEKIPSFSEIVSREKSYFLGRERVEKLKEILPRELFAVALQAEVDGRIIARETLPALKKDVTGYLYGGDRTRKMKLWKKQQKGKKKLRERGKVDIPVDVFLKMLKK